MKWLIGKCSVIGVNIMDLFFGDLVTDTNQSNLKNNGSGEWQSGWW